MGENGAGKSTLIKVLTGVEHPDSRFNRTGRQDSFKSDRRSILRRLASARFIRKSTFAPTFPLPRIFMLGHEPHRFGSIHWRKMNELASQAIKRLGIDIDVTQPLGNYSVAIQQMVAIAASLEIAVCQSLILDEPTSSLDINESQPAL